MSSSLKPINCSLQRIINRDTNPYILNLLRSYLLRPWFGLFLTIPPAPSQATSLLFVFQPWRLFSFWNMHSLPLLRALFMLISQLGIPFPHPTSYNPILVISYSSLPSHSQCYSCQEVFPDSQNLQILITDYNYKFILCLIG